MVHLKTASANSGIRWCSPQLHRDSSQRPQLRSNMWVKLLEPLTAFCHDEALLLCQQSEIQWIAWIPDHGESILTIEQFCVV